MINCTISLLCSLFVTFGNFSIDFKLQSSKFETKRIILGNGLSCSQRRIGQLNAITVLKEPKVSTLLLGYFCGEINICLSFYTFLFFGHSASVIIYVWTDISAMFDWYGHVQRMAEGRLSKIPLLWMPEQKRARGKPKKKLDGRYKEGHERRKPK